MKIRTRIAVLCSLFAFGIGGLAFGVISSQNTGDSALSSNHERCVAGNELREGLRAEKNLEIKFYERQIANPTVQFANTRDYKVYANEKIALLTKDRDTVFAAKQC